MQRLIDANALKLSHCKECSLYPDKCMGKDCDCGAIIHINEMPTIDAVPSETLYDFIRGIGAITYGKERFFHEEIGLHCGLWYDRKSCEWITTQTAIEECLKAVRELDDY